MKEIEYKVEAPETLLPFLLAHVQGKSRNAVKGILARRQVLVDGTACTQFDAPLTPGQTVTVLPTGAEKAEELPFPILYEDDELLVVDKPAGLLSMATDREKERTAYRAATDYVRRTDPRNRVFIVHRLDRDTSGVLVFAKNEAMKRALQDNWDALVEKRGYTAVVEGAPAEASGTVKSFLVETATHLVFSGHPGKKAKEAVTHYQVMAKARGYALVEVSIDTGRKNQIRVHMQDLGCPVAGDKQYGAKTDPLGRLGLHAGELTLRHPRTKKRMELKAPLPAGFRKMFAER